MDRLLIVGNGGSGKSTLARRIGARLGIEVLHLDRTYWQPGWTPMDLAAFRDHVAELVARPRWVMDGNYGSTFDLRMPRADAIVWLDLPRWRCTARVLRRRIRYHGRVRPDLGPGCPEKVDREFLQWIWGYPTRAMPKLEKGRATWAPDTPLHRLRGRRDVRRFLAGLR